MRRTFVWMLVALLVSVPVSIAQEELGDVVRIMEDPEGDNPLTAADQPVEEDSPYRPADMLSLDLVEVPEGFEFILAVQELQGDATYEQGVSAYYGSYGYDIYFELMGSAFMLDITNRQGENDDYGYLRQQDPEYGWYDYVDSVEVTSDAETNTFTVKVPLQLLLDESGKQPRPGDRFSGFYAESAATDVATSFSFGFVNSRDRMPDTGIAPTSFEVNQGLVSTGHILAYSEIPVRVSNGEATTFLFEVEVTNEGDFFDTVIPSWSGGLENWIVTFPTGKMRLDPGETRTIPFLVTTPFAHEHGKYHPFEVKLQSQADPLAAGLLELGIRYLAIPQPAGHHPTLYLHDPGRYAFVNTVSGQDYAPEAEDETGEIGGDYSGTCGYNDAQGQVIPLSPGLRMGMDFDLDSVGEAEFFVTSEQQTFDFAYSGVFILDPKEPSPCDVARGMNIPGTVAIVEKTETTSLTGGQTKQLVSAIVPKEAGDYVPYEQGQNLWLGIVLHSEEPDAVFASPSNFGDFTTPQLVEDSSFFLPLSEYHDDVDDYFDALSGIDLYPLGGQERKVNPGEMAIFRLGVQNIGIEKTEIELDLTGSNLGWATLLGDTKIKLGPGEERNMAIAVLAPEGGHDGQLADITLHATKGNDDGIRSLIRFLAEVDTETDHPDDSGQLLALDEELQPAPAPFMPVLVLLFAAAFVARRRLL